MTGQIDPHTHRKQACTTPALRLPTGRLQHPLSDRDDQSGLFGQRDEVTRWDHTHHRVLPTDQGLDADHALGVDGVLRLIMQHHALLLDGLFDLGGHPDLVA